MPRKGRRAAPAILGVLENLGGAAHPFRDTRPLLQNSRTGQLPPQVQHITVGAGLSWRRTAAAPFYDGNWTCGLVETKIAQLDTNNAAINGPITKPLSPNTASPPSVDTSTR